MEHYTQDSISDIIPSKAVRYYKEWLYRQPVSEANMNLQSLYEDITGFWSDISPLVTAHIIFFIMLIWILKEKHIAQKVSGYFNSEDYQKWKTILDEFSLRPKLPWLLVLGLLFYFAILSNFLNTITSGFTNPLAFARSNVEFWLETNEDNLIYSLVDLGSYQSDPNIGTSEIIQFKEKLLTEFKAKNPEEYNSDVRWTTLSYVKWGKYYRYAIIGLLAFILVFILNMKRRENNILVRRFFIVLSVTFLCIVFTRYMAEQYLEKETTAEVSFVLQMIHRDDSWKDKKLGPDAIQQIECRFAGERVSAGETRHFWISRYLDGYLPREFTSHSPDSWTPPQNCTDPASH